MYSRDHCMHREHLPILKEKLYPITDCQTSISHLVCSLSFSAASFDIPLRASVTENGTATICVKMTATPENATLAKEVVVNLSTMDGSGMDEVAKLNG